MTTQNEAFLTLVTTVAFKGGPVDLFTKRYAEENRHGGRVITDMSFKMYVSCFARITAYFYVISRTITIE